MLERSRVSSIVVPLSSIVNDNEDGRTNGLAVWSCMTSLSLCIWGTGKKLRRAWIGNSNRTFGIWLRVQSSRLRRGCRNLIARFSLQASLADENAGGPNFKASTCMQLSHWPIHGWVANGSVSEARGWGG